MSGELGTRASDAEREQVAARLREATAEGRLTFAELADRAALAYAARSHAELARLTEDLSTAPSPGASRSLDGRRDRRGEAHVAAGASARPRTW